MENIDVENVDPSTGVETPVDYGEIADFVDGKRTEPERTEEKAETKAEPEPEPKAEAETKPPAKPSDEEVRRQLQAVRERIANEIMSKYSLSEEEETAFVSSPGKVIPKFVSKLFLDVYDAVYANMMAQLPQIIEPVLAQREIARRYEEEFYRQWPELAKPEYKETVRRIAAVYRQLNRDVKPEQAIKEIGAQAMTALGLQRQPEARPATSSSKATFKPAATGAAASSPSQPKPKSIWEEIAEEILKE